MLKRRLIPKLQLWRASPCKKYELVTTEGFKKIIKIGDAISQAKIYQAQNADELIFVDLESTGPNSELLDLLQKINENIFMPITIGGGVRTIENFRMLLAKGADKVAVNAAAIEEPRLITQAAAVFGSQCVVASIDFRKTKQGYQTFISRGQKDTGKKLVEWASECEKLGAGELLITSIDRDGYRSGLEIEAIRQVVEVVKIPVIAGGGCGIASHFVEGFLAGVDAITAGTFFCHRDQSPMQCRSHIKNAGIPIRLNL